ncbi:TolC family protein [Sulfurospirillum arsenophilum]|uniref:TolC family protein n=1 Tax=Sulfurospirillum arsenophilum TaxID=56698 RepID=UPI000694CC85|nr:TolC family protein [Sulfurospirillum arsenophilum]
MKYFNHTLKLSLATIIFLSLSGCSVAVQQLSQEEINTSSKADLAELKTVQQPVLAPISIDEAIQRALMYNRDHKLKTLEAQFEEKQLAMAEYGMWPTLMAQGGYTNRSNTSASNSRNVLTNGQTYDYSTSTDDDVKTAEARISWNIIDFGLSYVRAKQQADKVLIAQERQRKMDNQIEQDIREAYWKAVSAQNLLAQIEPVIVEVRQSIDESKQLETSLTGNLMDSLSFRREMLDILISLQNFRKDLLNAKPRLAVLMGMVPGTPFELSGKIDEKAIKTLHLDMEKMEMLAFAHRPELMESRYQNRISLQETKAAMLSLLPSISFDAGTNYTSNSYAYNNSWFDYGAHVSMNLFKVFTINDLQERAKMGENVAQEQQKAVAMAILTQVHLADIRYNEALEGWDASNQYYTVVQKISDISEKANANNIGTKQQLSREKLSKLIANVKRDIAYAEVQNSYGNLFFSIGLPNNSHQIEQIVQP